MASNAEILTSKVIDSFRNKSEAGDNRINVALQSLVKHMHAFINEVKPTEDEWITAINFLTDTGKKCSDTRQEFILLSDILGISSLIQLQNNEVTDKKATEPNSLGPFHTNNPKPRDLGSSIIESKSKVG